ncbi:MAG: selenocysteine-specific translation elongation factor [Dehalococcoidia bacterium]|nr:selenocysteine-specific translation elongation factor [Dehalococcoidia bacterium]
MYVIGTAGHVDHGKSALVQALTGIDPDRLREEKERGMTIDLGFAWLALPSGRSVSIVDVPGHERFIKNMLAGVGGIDLALLVVAADEGVMPQTVEHLAILDLLRIQQSVIVITKKDLVDDEWLGLIADDVKETVEGTVLEDSPIVSVSAYTGEGLPELAALLDDLLANAPAKKDIGRPRLPVDRVFTIAGFGTVVTGTLIDGTLTVGQEVELLPSRIKTRIRGLQTHRQKEEIALPGTRVAANLTNVSTDDISRGDIVTYPGWLRPTQHMDVRLRLLEDAPYPLRHNAGVTFHTGSAEADARIRLLEQVEVLPGETTLAQLRLSSLVAVAKGDLFIIRSTESTLGGGEIIDPYPKRHRLLHEETLQQLKALESGSRQEVLLGLLHKEEPCKASALSSLSGTPEHDLMATLKLMTDDSQLVVLTPGELDHNSTLISHEGWSKIEDKIITTLEGYHKQHPLRSGMPKSELRNRLQLNGQAAVETVERAVKGGLIAEAGNLVRLPSHKISLSSRQETQVKDFLSALMASPYSPPSDITLDPELLGMLTEEGQIVRISDNVIFAREAYGQMVNKITDEIKTKGKITVAEVRDMFSTSRKYALALLEHLDDEKLTRRVGDDRVLR